MFKLSQFPLEHRLTRLGLHCSHQVGVVGHHLGRVDDGGGPGGEGGGAHGGGGGDPGDREERGEDRWVDVR